MHSKFGFWTTPYPKERNVLWGPLAASASQQIFGLHSRPLRASSLREPAPLENSPPDLLLVPKVPRTFSRIRSQVSAAIRQWPHPKDDASLGAPGWSLAPDTKTCAACFPLRRSPGPSRVSAVPENQILNAFVYIRSVKFPALQVVSV